MYPSKGSNPYGQQPYGAQQAYGQMTGSAYAVGGMDSGAQHALASRQSSMTGLGSAQEADISGYRSHPSQASQYGGPYANIYGSSSLSSAQQVAGISGKGPVSTNLTSRTTYPSVLPEPSKFSSGALSSSLGMTNDDYVSAANRGFSQKAEQYSSLTNMDYASLDRRNYGENQGSYTGRDFQSDTGRRYGDSVSLSHQHQSEFHDLMDQTSLLRQQQILKAQSLQSGSDMRQADYFAARAAPTHHGSQDSSSYGGRLDADPRSLSILGNAPYGGQHTASLLGGAPRRNVDELVYAQGSSSSSYGVGLPPGRDYGAGKGLHGPTIESNYQGSVMSRGHPGFGVSMDDERKDDRTAHRRELDLRDEEHRRELMREREKEREREERQRERERERERQRLRVRREEREWDRKRGPDSRRERTPPRATRERRGSSIRDEKPLRRVSPRRDAVHRHHSPVKEKKREYICKVFPFRLVDVERDYLSLSKRYPKLTIASDFCKVVFNWPKEMLSLSLCTPVSFEHGFVEAVEKADEKGIVCSDGSLSTKGGDTVWNAKVILLSGASIDALDDLCSEKSTSERIMHFNNILKFAVLRKDHSFMAIGGPWNVTIDGGDPLVNDSCLIQTAVRHVKDLTQLDLHDCQHWNRFLELHYDRVGKDGLFSHREITVLFLPDLSECLPSIELWRNQWLANKKEMAEREQQQTLKHEKKPGESKDNPRGNQSHNKTFKADSVKSYKSDDNIVKVEKISPNTDDQDKSGTNGSNNVAAEQEGKRPSLDEKQIELKNEEFVDSGGKVNEIIVQDDTPVDPAIENKKPTKKKIVKKVVKGKVVRKKETSETAEEAIAKNNQLMEVKEGDKHGKEDDATQEDHNSTISLSVKTFVRKKIVKKVPVNKSSQEDKSVKAKAENEPEEMIVQDDKCKVENEHDGSSILQESGGKTTGKKKVIRRVIKRKVSSSKEKDFNAANNNVEASKEGLKDHVEKKDEDTVSVRSPQNKITESKEMPLEKDNLVEKKRKEEKGYTKETVSSNDNLKAVKGGSKGSNEELPNPKDTKKDGQDGMDRIDEKVKRSTEEKLESKQRSRKEVKGKTKPEEPPKHPGLILQTKRSNETKIRSVTLSLDALLDYNDKDIEESTFELSIFAESFNEMLQYQMGCRLLAFLERLRKRYLIRRNQRKRERDEKSEKGNEKVSEKRLKTDGCPNEDISVKFEKEDVSNKGTGESADVDDSADTPDEPKLENKTEEDEIEYEDDPEEIIEEDQDMDAAAASNDGDQELQDMNEDKSANLVEQPEKMAIEDDEEGKVANEPRKNQTVEPDEKSDAQDKQTASEKRDAEKEDVIDKELFQAFRYFDRNRVGYIKVEDLRCIIHNLGKFLCHRDVKEMVQSALFESNSARDDRIFYKKLVNLLDI